MFLISINGKATALMSTFDSAVSYVDAIQGSGCRVTITTLRSSELVAALRSLEEREVAGIDHEAPRSER